MEQAEVTLKEIYEKVSLKVPLEQRRFFNFFNDTVAELEALYPDLLFKEGVHFTDVYKRQVLGNWELVSRKMGIPVNTLKSW